VNREAESIVKLYYFYIFNTFPLTDHILDIYQTFILVLFVTITFISLKLSSSSSCANMNWSYPFEQTPRLKLLELDVAHLHSSLSEVEVVEFSDAVNDPFFSY